MRPFIIIIISCSIGITSCSNPVEVDESKVFRLNRYDNISSLDPVYSRTQANTWACNLMYNSLVKIGYDLNTEPDIAKSWEISNEGKTYTFILRNDVYFHKNPVFGKDSTRLVTAHDFSYSFDRLGNPETSGAGGWVLNNVKDYKALNDSIFQINLKEAFPPMLGLLSMKYCSVVPKEMFEKGMDFNKNPLGTGPFAFKIWEDNVKLVFRKNPLYFEKDEKGTALPYLEAVSIQFLPEKNSEFLQLIQGNFDIMADLDPSYKDELLTAQGELNPKYTDKIDMFKFPYLSTIYLCFYLDAEKPVDEKLRKAINYGVDKDKIIKYLMKGIGYAGKGGFIPNGLPGYEETSGYKYDPRLAKQLIDEYKKEHKTASVNLTTVQEYVDICEFLQAELGKLGLRVNVNVVPGPTMRDGKATGKFEFFRANWGADYPDAENFLSLYYSKNFAPEGPNYSHYKSKEFDRLYELSYTITNEKERAEIYREMDKLMMESAPIVPLFYDQTTIFIAKNVHGFKMSPIKLLDLTRVYKTE